MSRSPNGAGALDVVAQASSGISETAGYRSMMQSIAEASSGISETAGYRSMLGAVAAASTSAIVEAAGHRGLIDAVTIAVEQVEPSHPEKSTAEPARDAPTIVEGCPDLLDALIAVGLAGRDLTIIATTLAWLITIREAGALGEVPQPGR